jgi:hypothetical protein
MAGEALKANGKFLRSVLVELGLLPAAHMDSPPEQGPWTPDRLADYPFGWVSGMLIQLISEWSDEGASEREQRYKPAIEALRRLVPPPKPPAGQNGGATSTKRPRVLVPGAGLGRMAWDLAQHGYDVIGVGARHVAAVTRPDGEALARRRPSNSSRPFIPKLMFAHMFACPLPFWWRCSQRWPSP